MDCGLPDVKNCVFAVRLDMKKKTEEILIGEFSEVCRRIDGFSGARLYFEKTRDIGRLVMDYAPITGDVSDIRAALMDSTSRKKSPYFDRAVSMLAEYGGSDNPVFRFTALLMWQEYRRAMRDRKAAESLFDTLDDITLALRFHMIDEVKAWQGMNRKNPLEYLDRDFRKYPVSLYYGGDEDTGEYAATDKSLLAIAVYYLKRVYDSGRFIQSCPICGRSFVAKTAGMTTLCSDECRRAQGRENKRRFDGRAREISYERAYKNTYMYWYNKVMKRRGMDLPEAKMEALESAFKAFGKESAARKKQVARAKSDASDYEAWLLAQRNVIDGLIAELEV